MSFFNRGVIYQYVGVNYWTSEKIQMVKLGPKTKIFLHVYQKKIPTSQIPLLS